ncbi:hypothetical protein K3G63_17580 [Hymenobacter sp. HSC-4F20]|uniref:hypothetical protein n=1 Tax=Hymenobacter sp. HSC-4F20 TaxID=2864135 RepID=UPI001C72FC81|nr:hypothetical protein [Hymenobacter sp. HSC-4F20]MBX0292263.1 hypothetical protein [Hymenobacter sp. HSC-4F20]
MEKNPKYGPAAQTPQQRAYVLAQMQATQPNVHKAVTEYVAQLYRRYVDGELSWQDVCTLREATQT